MTREPTPLQPPGFRRGLPAALMSIVQQGARSASDGDYVGVVPGLAPPARAGEFPREGPPGASCAAQQARGLVCVYEFVDAETILPITAFEPDKE